MRKCLFSAQEVLVVKGYSHLSNIRNKKLGEANQRCSMLAALWDHLQGFASHPAFGQGAAGLKPVGDELPVIPQPAGGRAGTGAQGS